MNWTLKSSTHWIFLRLDLFSWIKIFSLFIKRGFVDTIKNYLSLYFLLFFFISRFILTKNTCLTYYSFEIVIFLIFELWGSCYHANIYCKFWEIVKYNFLLWNPLLWNRSFFRLRIKYKYSFFIYLFCSLFFYWWRCCYQILSSFSNWILILETEVIGDLILIRLVLDLYWNIWLIIQWRKLLLFNSYLFHSFNCFHLGQILIYFSIPSKEWLLNKKFLSYLILALIITLSSTLINSYLNICKMLISKLAFPCPWRTIDI